MKTIQAEVMNCLQVLMLNHNIKNCKDTQQQSATNVTIFKEIEAVRALGKAMRNFINSYLQGDLGIADKSFLVIKIDTAGEGFKFLYLEGVGPVCVERDHDNKLFYNPQIEHFGDGWVESIFSPR